MSLLNSVSDLQPLAIKALADKQWHCFADVLCKIGDDIMPERAVRFYQGQGGGDRAASKDGGDTRPLDERIRAGQRRGTYLILRSMIKRKMVECKNESCNPDDREYRLVTDVLARRGGSHPRPNSPARKGNAIVGMVEELQRAFAEFPESGDSRDFRFHCRHLKRIALLQTARALPQSQAEASSAEPPPMSPPVKE